MSGRRLAGTTLIVLLSVGMLGCASLGVRKSDEDVILETLEGWRAALKGDDVEVLLAFYSDDYVGRRGSGKTNCVSA